MSHITKVIVLNHPDNDEPAPEAVIGALSGVEGASYRTGHGRIIIEAPVERADEVLSALRGSVADLDNMREYDLPEPSGVDLTVNFMYRESGQVCSATVDERLWGVMAASDSGVSDALITLYQDVEIPPYYDPDLDIVVQDVVRNLEFWSP